MIQNIAPYTFHNEYRPRSPKDDDVVFFFSCDHIFLNKDGNVFHLKDISNHQEYYYLFSIDDHGFFLGSEKPDEYKEIPVRALRTYQPGYMGFAAITAWQIFAWRKENIYCGKCGEHMQDDDVERARKCPKCGHIIYPKISPAVIVGVLNDRDQLLVTIHEHETYYHYALIAGYTEIGETIEETVQREVREEVGLQVKDIEYCGCQPWAFSSTLLMGFWCHVEGDDTIHEDHVEIENAAWIDRDTPIYNPDDVSLTATMIHAYQKGNNGHGL